MSIAGTRSSQGDEYHLRVALHWTIRLLVDPAVKALQSESTGLPGEEPYVSVDDVVILLTDGRRIYVQAKKNESGHATWSLGNSRLQEEILKARDQLEGDARAQVYFYSQTPFGDLHRLAEDARIFPDYGAFASGASGATKQILARFARIVGRDEAAALRLGARFFFGPAHTLEDWDRLNLTDLGRVIPNPLAARDVLERLLGSHQAKLRNAPFLLCKEDVVSALEARGLYPAPPYSHSETIAAFRTASSIGREWIRTVDGERFNRPEVDVLHRAINARRRDILVTDSPGGGKTCMLLDLADWIERDPGMTLLFIKADLFAEASCEADLQRLGLPEDIVGRCARLAASGQVVVVIDSLDVLSLYRSHGSLRLFLGLIDRLRTIDGVTVVAACRDFDLHYDPLLRGRSWGETVAIQPLEFDSQVAPLLSRWGVALDELTDEVKALLRVPQHLRIFQKVARGSVFGPGDVASSYHLYERYLHESVAADPLLGPPAMAVLTQMAEHLIEQRTLTLPRVMLDGWVGDQAGPEAGRLVRRLISQQIVSEPRPTTLSFSHQTLLDCLAVHGALSRGETLLEFIRGKLPVPFIRPTVRVFFFYLCAQDRARFRKQVRATLNDDSLAYHLRRLVAESLAEIIPDNNDWPLFRWILKTHPDLFLRLLGKTRGDEWLLMLSTHVLPLLRGEPDLYQQWLLPLVSHLRTWVRTHLAEVVAIWRAVLSETPPNQPERRSHLTWSILSSLDEATVWGTEGIRDLLEEFVDVTSEDHRHLIGRALSLFVRATGTGDDLLWRFLTPSAPSEPAHVDYDPGDGVRVGILRFNRHEVPDEFLESRLAESDWLLNRFIETVVLAKDGVGPCGDWPDDAWPAGRIRSGCLGNTSYRRRHSRGVIMGYEGENFLLDVLELVLKCRAAHDDAWWREHEPLLRQKDDLGIRYLLIQAYRANPVANADGVAAQLCDPELLSARDLDHELGELTLDTYPYVPDNCREQHQRLVLGLHDLDTEADWREVRARTIYELLHWVPRPFRLPEAQVFLDQWEPLFGPVRPAPRLHISDSSDPPLVSVDELLRLSSSALVRLAQFFDAQIGTSRVGEYGGERGRQSLQSVLRSAAELAPSIVLDQVGFLSTAGVHDGYIAAVATGVANHLRYRAGYLKPMTEWTPQEPLADAEELANRLLDMLDRYPALWSSQSTPSEAAEACAHVLLEEAGVARLTTLLDELSRRRPPPEIAAQTNEAKTREVRHDGLLNEAINRPRGVAARAAMHFCNHLIEHDRTIPDLLIHTIHSFAADSEPSTRVGVLHILAYAVYTRPEIGWPIVEVVLRRDPETAGATPPSLWKYLEPVLYHQYHDQYDRVGPLLSRLRSEGIEGAAETYGRISALSWLASHITADELFTDLAGAPDGTWKGTAQVLCANLKSAAYRAECRTGLLRMLNHEKVPDETIDYIAFAFNDEGPGAHLTAEIALALISAGERRQANTSGNGRFIRLSGVAKWVVLEALRDPLSALRVIEGLTQVFDREGRMSLYNADSLVAALSTVLREADEMDDRELLLRVLSVQDMLLRFGLSEVEELLNRAARP